MDFFQRDLWRPGFLHNEKWLEFTNTHEDVKSGLNFYQLHSNLCCSGPTIFCRNLSEQFRQRLPLAFLSPRSTPGCRYIQGLQHSQLPDNQSREGGCVHQSQPGSNLPPIFHTLLSFFKRLSGDSQLHQKNFCWLHCTGS